MGFLPRPALIVLWVNLLSAGYEQRSLGSPRVAPDLVMSNSDTPARAGTACEVDRIGSPAAVFA